MRIDENRHPRSPAGLDDLRRAGVAPEERMAEAIDLLRRKHDEHGRWPLENPHPGPVHFEMEGGGRLEIGFDGERFALWFSRQPSAEHKRTRPQVQRDARTAQTAGGNLQAGAQAGRSTPAHGDDAAAPGETQTIDNF